MEHPAIAKDRKSGLWKCCNCEVQEVALRDMMAAPCNTDIPVPQEEALMWAIKGEAPAWPSSERSQ